MCSLTILKLKISLKRHLFFRRIVLAIHYIYCVLNVYHARFVLYILYITRILLSAQVDKSWIVRRMLTDLYLFYLNLTHYNTRIIIYLYIKLDIIFILIFKPINQFNYIIQYITLEIIFFIYYCIIVL